jgi:ABC-2 type transport system permease protein
MLHDKTMNRIIRKELTLFFTSPIAYLFLATFAAITLFVFFWGETFFARNISDVRPLFEWMPILLIFLTSTLTMRLWSEERRSGTLEHILTQPIAIWRFVLAKFFACLVLLAIALLITLPLPLMVSLIGELDWGPVLSGYLAALLLGAAYLSIGLFVSARSDNQIVSLISATALCGLLYIIGSPAITDFFGNQLGEWLRLLGTGSRFDDINRGVIDFRDLFYYLSLIVIFLALNTYSLEQERWSKTGDRSNHFNWRLAIILLVFNVTAANLWLGQLNVLRVDTTEGKIYSISDATRHYLSQLQEPLLIRGYFSSKTHPLLAPLVPQVRDLINEYKVVAKGNVRVEFIDPASDPEQEDLANQKYGIQPVPFKVADRYQASVVNSYFNVLIEYGDQFQVLGFRDLIEIKSQGEGDLNVLLRNPEYDITRAIKKVMLAYQSGGNLFDTVKGDLNFTAYVSADDKLPKELIKFKSEVTKILEQKKQQAGGRLKTRFIDPNSAGGSVAKQILKDYGFKPMVASLFDANEFYFYLTLSKDGQVVQIPLGDFSPTNFELALESGIKRFAGGFTKTVAMVTPSADPQMARYGLSGAQFNQLSQILGDDFNVKHDDLSKGEVDTEADVLLLMAPKDLNERQLFAVDQFLMRGGTVIAATSPYSVNLSGKSLSMQPYTSGLDEWLRYHGIDIEQKLVMDAQNSAFPVPVTRQMGGFRFQEVRMIDYPYFADLRGDSLNRDNSITSGLNQLNMAWASPVNLDDKKLGDKKVTRVLHSSNKAWLSTSTNVMPSVDRQGRSTFTVPDETGQYVLGAIVQGSFSSYFTDKDIPLLEKQDAAAESENKETDAKKDAQNVISSVIEHSPESARIIVFASNDFLSDQVIQLSGSVGGTQYLSGLELMSNTLDWSLEEQGLLSIRSRGHFNRTLPPMQENEQIMWESGNYVMAVLLLVLLAWWQHVKLRARNRHYLKKFSA